MSIAFIFPGQGSQCAGMGCDLAEHSVAARQVFTEADEALGLQLSRLCFEGPDEDLQLTANTQPAILAASIAAYRALEGSIQPAYVAGHSLGEYSALVAAGSLTLGDALRLVRRRGELMQEAVPVGLGAMAAILGLDAKDVTEACAEAAHGEVCGPANFNTPNQTVIAGSLGAVERAVEECKRRGARRAIMLKVSAPFHSPLMRSAQEGMAPLLNSTEFRDPVVPVVNNVDGAVCTSGAAARESLIRQVTAPVQWTKSVEELLNRGVDSFVEVGPGKVLLGLVRSIAKGKDVSLLNVEDQASLEATLSTSGKQRPIQEGTAS
jgi:[acyl-carrier-protein] S-malonyltransferase